MKHTLTLIATPEGKIALREISGLRRAIEVAGGGSGEVIWLAVDRVADIPFTGLAGEQVEAIARRIFQRIDIIAQPLENRRKKLFVADMDSTILENETLDELSELVGLKDHVSAITSRAMNGEIDFVTALHERVALLGGLPIDSLEEAWSRTSYMPGARTLLKTMKKNGVFAVLASGGFDFFTSRVRLECGFDRDFSNYLEVVDGRLTGKVSGQIIDGHAKLQILKNIAEEQNIPLSLSMAVGDGANDLGMIQAAGAGIAFHAKKIVADKSRIRIDYCDLTSLLFIQGYREEEFELG